MRLKTKNFTEGKADAGLLFVAGLFFLTLAGVVVYFSYFGTDPLPRLNKTSNGREGMSAAAVRSLSEVRTVSDEITSLVGIRDDGQDETQNKVFFASLSAIPVKEIFIGSYGSMDKEILEGLRSSIEKTYGVETTLLNPGPAIPKEEPFYNKSRNQYNSDVLFKSVQQSSAIYGPAVRFLYVADINMSSFSVWAPEPSWLRAEKDVNAAIVSFSVFGQKTDVLLGRVEKAAVRALGITVGFDSTPSVADASCVMYPALTVEDLDMQNSALCHPESEAVARVFQK
jgi:predicted Zn-dependent protease